MLAVRVTDGLATCEYLLENSSQMVLPLRGEGYFILCCVWQAQNPTNSYCGDGSHPSPNKGRPQFSAPDTQS